MFCARWEAGEGHALDYAAKVTALAAFLGGIFAAFKWQVFRENESHPTIMHEDSRRSVGDNYDHIAMTKTLQPTALATISAARRAYRCAPRADRQVRSGCHACR